MTWLLRLIWLLWGKQALVREYKRRSLAVYLRAIRTARLSLIGVLAIFLFLQLMMLSGVGALVTGFMLWSSDFQTKLEILFWIFAGAFAIPAVTLMILLSEWLWFRLSGARQMMDDLYRRD